MITSDQIVKRKKKNTTSGDKSLWRKLYLNFKLNMTTMSTDIARNLFLKQVRV